MCDIIWCKEEVDGKPCNTVNYLDPYCFWNWKGTVNCAHCGAVYAIHMIQGHMYEGPTKQPAGTKPDTMPLLDRIVYRLKDIRRFGSIALDLCFVADGRFDLFWSYDALPYDIAAGELIAREAGATVTDLDGGNDYEQRHQIAATNGLLHEELIELVRLSAQEKIR